MRPAICLVCVLLASVALAGDPASAVAQLTNPHTADAAWKPIVQCGAAAIPALEKLLTSGDEEVQARAAALLYRLGKAEALDKLATLLESKAGRARREAAAALLAYVGQPADFRDSAAEDERQASLAEWKAWWKANRETALKMKPMGQLFGKVLAVDAKGELIAISLLDRHGARAGMKVAVRRGDQAVCSLEIIMAGSSSASVTRIVEMTAVSQPEVGDLFFSLAK